MSNDLWDTELIYVVRKCPLTISTSDQLMHRRKVYTTKKSPLRQRIRLSRHTLSYRPRDQESWDCDKCRTNGNSGMETCRSPRVHRSQTSRWPIRNSQSPGKSARIINHENAFRVVIEPAQDAPPGTTTSITPDYIPDLIELEATPQLVAGNFSRSGVSFFVQGQPVFFQPLGGPW